MSSAFVLSSLILLFISISQLIHTQVVELVRPKKGPWKLPIVIEDARVIRCQMGPAGPLDRGYSLMTGRQTYGLVWWCNGVLAPEIIVYIGTTYTFLIEGGDDWDQQDKFNPFYITDDPRGGLGVLSPNATKPRVFAGIRWNPNGQPFPTAAGKYCEWTTKDIDANIRAAPDFETFKSFFQLECDNPSAFAGVLRWTPQEGLPDTLYYQSFTRINTGFVIRVNDKRRAHALSGIHSWNLTSAATLQGLFIGVVTTVTMATVVQVLLTLWIIY